MRLLTRKTWLRWRSWWWSGTAGHAAAKRVRLCWSQRGQSVYWPVTTSVALTVTSCRWLSKERRRPVCRVPALVRGPSAVFPDVLCCPPPSVNSSSQLLPCGHSLVKPRRWPDVRKCLFHIVNSSAQRQIDLFGVRPDLEKTWDKYVG